MPTATVRPRAAFGRPGDVDPAIDAVVVVRRARATPVPNEWKEHFPVGVWMGNGTIALRNPGASTTTLYSPNNIPGQKAALEHGEQGLKDSGIDYQMFGSLAPFTASTLTAEIDAHQRLGPSKWIWAPTGRLNAGVSSGILLDWYVRAPANQTYNDAITLVTEILAAIGTVGAHPSVLGYFVGDDLTLANAPAAIMLVRAFQDLDPGRFAFFTANDPAIYALADFQTYCTKVAIGYRYATGRYANNTPTLEGDFHRSTFAGNDFVDEIRERYNGRPPGCRLFMPLGCHDTSSTSDTSNTVRYPTAREIRKQFWNMIGEGVTGIFAFTYDSVDVLWVGLGEVSRLDSLQVFAELSERLTPAIRTRLLACDKAADAFVTTGGESTTYPVNYGSAYVSTLHDRDSGDDYCVVCNNSLSTASVIISSPTLTGKLTNLETRIETYLPATVSLPALDGAIYRLDPIVGVPSFAPSMDESVEAHWARSPWNPDSPTFIPPGAAKLYPRQVTVTAAAGSLQTIVNANPDETTFLIEPGYTPPIGEPKLILTGRRGLHFVSTDPTALPSEQPIIRFLEIYGSAESLIYTRTIAGVPGFNVKAGLPATWGDQALYDWTHPKSNFIFRDIQFRSDGTPLWYHKYLWETTGLYTPDHFAEWHPIWIRNVRDLLVERCEYFDYVAGHDVVQDTEGQPTATGGVTQWHGGMSMAGNAGNENIVVRYCATHGEKVRGYPYAFFLDGARGFVCASNDFTDGKWTQGSIASLTNDDWTDDWNKDGVVDQANETRNARQCVIFDNDLIWGGTSPMNMTGREYLVKENRLHLDHPSNPVPSVSRLAILYARASRVWYKNSRYHNEDSVFDGNEIIGGNIGALVETQPDDGYAFGGLDLRPHNLHGTVGRVHYKNNTVEGDLISGQWVRDILAPPQSLVASIPSLDEGGNTDNTVGPPPTYLVNDLYTSGRTESALLTSGPASPGPGTRTIRGNNWRLRANHLIGGDPPGYNEIGAWGDRVLHYGGHARAAGRTMGWWGIDSAIAAEKVEGWRSTPNVLTVPYTDGSQFVIRGGGGAPNPQPGIRRYSAHGREIQYQAMQQDTRNYWRWRGIVLGASGAVFLESTFADDDGESGQSDSHLPTPGFPVARISYIEADTTFSPAYPAYDCKRDYDAYRPGHVWGGIEVADVAAWATEFPLSDWADSFSRADNASVPGNSWTVVSGTWGVQAGVLRLTGGSGHRIVSRVLPARASNDMVFRCTLHLGAVVPDFSIIPRYQDATNYVTLTNVGLSNQFHMRSISAGVATTIQAGGATWATNTDYDLMIFIVGDAYHVVIDHNPAIAGHTYRENTGPFKGTAANTIAFRCNQTDSWIDDVAIYPTKVTLPTILTQNVPNQNVSATILIAEDDFSGVADGATLPGRVTTTGSKVWTLQDGTYEFLGGRLQLRPSTKDYALATFPLGGVTDWETEADFIIDQYDDLENRFHSSIGGYLNNSPNENWALFRIAVYRAGVGIDQENEIERIQVHRGTSKVEGTMTIGLDFPPAVVCRVRCRKIGPLLHVLLNHPATDNYYRPINSYMVLEDNDLMDKLSLGRWLELITGPPAPGWTGSWALAVRAWRFN